MYIIIRKEMINVAKAQPINMEALENAVQLACILDDLKTRIRSGWIIWRVRSKRLESVAEHIYSCLVLANLIHPLCPDCEQIDIGKVNKMIIFHEIGETVIGDVPLIDKARHGSKAAAEHAAWRKLLKGLPYEQEVYDLLIEFDDHRTPESKYAYCIDKIDATKSMKRYYDERKFHSLKWYLEHSKTVRDNDDIQKIVADGAKTPADIWFADKYAPYDGNKFFMAVHQILREMDTNISPPTL